MVPGPSGNGLVGEIMKCLRRCGRFWLDRNFGSLSVGWDQGPHYLILRSGAPFLPLIVSPCKRSRTPIRTGL